ACDWHFRSVSKKRTSGRAHSPNRSVQTNTLPGFCRTRSNAKWEDEAHAAILVLDRRGSRGIEEKLPYGRGLHTSQTSTGRQHRPSRGYPANRSPETHGDRTACYRPRCRSGLVASTDGAGNASRSPRPKSPSNLARPFVAAHRQTA